jgi:hypothetical protein
VYAARAHVRLADSKIPQPSVSNRPQKQKKAGSIKSDRPLNLILAVAYLSAECIPRLIELGDNEASLGNRDGAANFLGCFDPFSDHYLDVGESLAIALAAGGASGKLGDFSDKGPIFSAVLRRIC